LVVESEVCSRTMNSDHNDFRRSLAPFGASSIRPSLLADQRDQEDWRRGLGLVLLCLLLSVWVHLVGFISWQYLDKNAADNFVFELQPENPTMELTLVFNEPMEIQSETGMGAARPDSAETPSAASAEEDPAAMTAMASNVPGVNGELVGGEMQTSDTTADPTLVKPEPPIRVEGEAPERKSYYTAIRMAVNSRWIIPPAAKNSYKPGRLTIDFTINSQGGLERWLTIKSTGSEPLDHAGQEAIRSAAPFPPFPDDLNKFSQLDIRMHFDYKAQPLPRPTQP